MGIILLIFLLNLSWYRSLSGLKFGSDLQETLEFYWPLFIFWLLLAIFILTNGWASGGMVDASVSKTDGAFTP